MEPEVLVNKFNKFHYIVLKIFVKFLMLFSVISYFNNLFINDCSLRTASKTQKIQNGHFHQYLLFHFLFIYPTNIVFVSMWSISVSIVLEILLGQSIKEQRPI